MKIATWNVNSIRARHDAVLGWVAATEPDVLCMQETKVVDDDFPTEEFLRLGYAVAMAGQKTYNGIALASRLPMTDIVVGFHDEPDPDDKRLIRATVGGVRVYSVYVPNGKSLSSPSYEEKLRFLGRLGETVQKDGGADVPMAICGDFNIAPDERDVFDPRAMEGKIHFSAEEHRALANLVGLGLVDVFRMHHEEGGRYSWWDYRGGGFERNLGLRIDLVLATRALAPRCTGAEIDEAPRRGDKPSDHTPVVATFS
ncbi:MAG TPA: exodeoxyribonuclease III [Polyangiaceae bacterium]|nr:exodeoxyribonuclease III [Polyangiaceae bacterium]